MPNQETAHARRQFKKAFAECEKAFLKRYHARCERIAEIYNREALRFLRSHHMVPPPPNVFLDVGNRVWRNLLCAWRDLCFAMATEYGYEKA